MRDVQVVMLAAGLGTRLWPLTSDRGKPTVPFLGRPIARGMLDWLYDHGARRVVVNTHHRPASIREALSAPPVDMAVDFSHEEEILGTAGALARARDLGLLDRERTTLVVNAKLITRIDLRAALAAHRRAGSSVTLILRRNLQREAFTHVRVDGGRVLGFGPSRVPEGDDPLLFTGLHFLEPSVLARAEARFSDTIRDLYPAEIAAGRVLAHIDGTGTWVEASTLERYLDLQVEALDGAPAVDPTARVAEGARIERSVVGSVAQVERDACILRSVLWKGVRVGEGARVEGAVLAEDVEVPRGADLRGVVAVRPALAADPPPGAPPVRLEHGLALVPLRLSSGSSPS